MKIGFFNPITWLIMLSAQYRNNWLFIWLFFLNSNYPSLAANHSICQTPVLGVQSDHKTQAMTKSHIIESTTGRDLPESGPAASMSRSITRSKSLYTYWSYSMDFFSFFILLFFIRIFFVVFVFFFFLFAEEFIRVCVGLKHLIVC